MIFGVCEKQIQKSEQIVGNKMPWCCQRHVCQEVCLPVPDFNYLEGFLTVVGFTTPCNHGLKIFTWLGMSKSKEKQGMELWPFAGNTVSDWMWKSNFVCFQRDHSAGWSCRCCVRRFLPPDRNALRHLATRQTAREPCLCEWVLPLEVTSQVSVSVDVQRMNSLGVCSCVCTINAS